jgi:hypothetical protein
MIAKGLGQGLGSAGAGDTLAGRLVPALDDDGIIYEIA